MTECPGRLQSVDLGHPGLKGLKAEHWFHFLAFSPAIFHASSNP